jgi:hypothetical protein
VNRHIVLAAARGILLRNQPSLLQIGEGKHLLTNSWASSLLKRMKYVKRKGTKTAKKVPTNLPEISNLFWSRISSTVEKYKIPPELTVNTDETGAKYVPVSEWTMEEQGSNQVSLCGLDDKRQMTVFLSISVQGDILPPQLIYEGKTNECHPKGVQFPDSWDITHTDSHWSTETSVLRFIENILVPYFEQKKQSLGLPPEQKSLLIWDVYRPHRTEKVLKKLEENNILVIFTPANCTSELQPLDLVLNAVFKRHQRDYFTEWYASEVASQMENGIDIENISIGLQLSVVKPRHATWLMGTMEKLSQQPNLVFDAFSKAGIMDIFLGTFESVAQPDAEYDEDSDSDQDDADSVTSEYELRDEVADLQDFEEIRDVDSDC